MMERDPIYDKLFSACKYVELAGVKAGAKTRRLVKDFTVAFLFKERLFETLCKTLKNKDGKDVLRVVVPNIKARRLMVMKACHMALRYWKEYPHLDFNSTLKVCQKIFWWEGLEEDVQEYCKGCPDCKVQPDTYVCVPTGSTPRCHILEMYLEDIRGIGYFPPHPGFYGPRGNTSYDLGERYRCLELLRKVTTDTDIEDVTIAVREAKANFNKNMQVYDEEFELEFIRVYNQLYGYKALAALSTGGIRCLNKPVAEVEKMLDEISSLPPLHLGWYLKKRAAGIKAKGKLTLIKGAEFLGEQGLIDVYQNGMFLEEAIKNHVKDGGSAEHAKEVVRTVTSQTVRCSGNEGNITAENGNFVGVEVKKEGDTEDDLAGPGGEATERAPQHKVSNKVRGQGDGQDLASPVEVITDGALQDDVGNVVVAQGEGHVTGQDLAGPGADATDSAPQDDMSNDVQGQGDVEAGYIQAGQDTDFDTKEKPDTIEFGKDGKIPIADLGEDETGNCKETDKLVAFEDGNPTVRDDAEDKIVEVDGIEKVDHFDHKAVGDTEKYALEPEQKAPTVEKLNIPQEDEPCQENMASSRDEEKHRVELKATVKSSVGDEAEVWKVELGVAATNKQDGRGTDEIDVGGLDENRREEAGETTENSQQDQEKKVKKRRKRRGKGKSGKTLSPQHGNENNSFKSTEDSASKEDKTEEIQAGPSEASSKQKQQSNEKETTVGSTKNKRRKKKSKLQKPSPQEAALGLPSMKGGNQAEINENAVNEAASSSDVREVAIAENQNYAYEDAAYALDLAGDVDTSVLVLTTMADADHRQQFPIDSLTLDQGTLDLFGAKSSHAQIWKGNLSLLYFCQMVEQAKVDVLQEYNGQEHKLLTKSDVTFNHLPCDAVFVCLLHMGILIEDEVNQTSLVNMHIIKCCEFRNNVYEFRYHRSSPQLFHSAVRSELRQRLSSLQNITTVFIPEGNARLKHYLTDMYTVRVVLVDNGYVEYFLGHTINTIQVSEAFKTILTKH